MSPKGSSDWSLQFPPAYGEAGSGRLLLGDLLTLLVHLPILHIHHQSPGLTEARADQHRPIGPVELGHFDGVPAFVTPVQVATHPVHSQPVGVAEASPVQHLWADKEEPACPGVGPSASLALSFPMCKVRSSAGGTTGGKGKLWA